MSPTILDGISTDETTNLTWIPAIAVPTAPSLATEYNAGTSVKLECLLVQTFSADASVSKNELRRMCSSKARERAGIEKRSIADLVGVYDPQDLTTALSKAYATLEKGASGFLVLRSGIHVDTAAIATDLVDVYKVTVDFRIKIAAADNDEHQFKAGISVQDWWEDVALVA